MIRIVGNPTILHVYLRNAKDWPFRELNIDQGIGGRFLADCRTATSHFHFSWKDTLSSLLTSQKHYWMGTPNKSISNSHICYYPSSKEGKKCTQMNYPVKLFSFLISVFVFTILSLVSKSIQYLLVLNLQIHSFGSLNIEKCPAIQKIFLYQKFIKKTGYISNIICIYPPFYFKKR